MKIDESVYVADRAIVMGDVTVGRDCGIWPGAVLRGDEGKIQIGDRTNVQDNAVLHMEPGESTVLGDDVTVGHGAIVHGCHVGNNVLIGMGSIILDGTKIGDNCIIGAGSLITMNKEIPAGSMVFGSPAKIKRQLTEDEIKSIKHNADLYVDLAADTKRESEKEKNK